MSKRDSFVSAVLLGAVWSEHERQFCLSGVAWSCITWVRETVLSQRFCILWLKLNSLSPWTTSWSTSIKLVGGMCWAINKPITCWTVCVKVVSRLKIINSAVMKKSSISQQTMQIGFCTWHSDKRTHQHTHTCGMRQCGIHLCISLTILCQLKVMFVFLFVVAHRHIIHCWRNLGRVHNVFVVCYTFHTLMPCVGPWGCRIGLIHFLTHAPPLY